MIREASTTMNAPRVLVGLIGFYPFVKGYPLGSDFVGRLKAPPWPDDAFTEEMNWGPVAIVQDLEARAAVPERVVLVTAVDRGLAPGSVHCRRWMGGAIDMQELQARMFEAVTGVIHVDNLLAIGEHFGVWPDEVITVEVHLHHASVGDYILDARAGCENSLSEAGAEAQLSKLVDRTRQAVLQGPAAISDLQELHANELVPVGDFCRNETTSGAIVYRH